MLYQIYKPIGRTFLPTQCAMLCKCLCAGELFSFEREKAKKVWKQTSENKSLSRSQNCPCLIRELRAAAQRLIAGEFFFSSCKAIDSQTLKIGEQRGTITTWLSGDKMETRAGTLISLTYFLSLSLRSVGTLIGALSVQPRPNPVFALSLRGITVPKSKEQVLDQTKEKTREDGPTHR